MIIELKIKAMRLAAYALVVVNIVAILGLAALILSL